MAVNDDDVEEHLGSTEISDFSTFIGAMDRFYDNLTSDDNVGTDVRDDVVALLAAHMVATGPERQISSAGEGGGNVSFEGETGQALRATTHGQQAILLDPTGKLATTDKPAPTITVPDATGTRD